MPKRDTTFKSSARAALNLGTASTKDVGTSPGNVPMLDGDGKIPAATVPAGENDVASSAVQFTATDRVLGRVSSGAGDGEEITCTAAGRALLDDADASAQRTTLGLGSLATQSGTFSGTSSGTNTGDQDLSGYVPTSRQVAGHALSGDVSISASDVGLGNVSNVAQIPASYLDTDGTLAGNSDVKVPSQKAVKTYADQLIAAADAMVFQGVIDCSSNPNYPAADRGHTYRVSVAGKIGGGSGLNVEVGDLLFCLTDSTASGTQAGVGSSWSVVQSNLDGAVIGPASVTDGHVALFDGTTGKLLKSAGVTLSGNNTGDQTNISGNAATATALATPRAIYGNNFDGSAALSQVIDSAYGGTGNGYTEFTGPASSKKTFTLPNASDTVACLGQQQAFTKQQNASVASLTSTSNSIAWDLSTQQSAKHTFTENTTLANPTNMVDGGTYVLRLIQHASSPKTLAFGNAYKWPGGTAFVVSPTNSAVDVLTFTSDGTYMYGVGQKAFA